MSWWLSHRSIRRTTVPWTLTSVRDLRSGFRWRLRPFRDILEDSESEDSTFCPYWCRKGKESWNFPLFPPCHGGPGRQESGTTCNWPHEILNVYRAGTTECGH